MGTSMASDKLQFVAIGKSSNSNIHDKLKFVGHSFVAIGKARTGTSTTN